MSDLTTRARKYGTSCAGLTSGQLALECAAALEAKDAEIARLTALVKDPLTTHLGTPAEDWAGMWSVANERANKAEAEAAKWRNAHRSRLKCPEGHSPGDSRGPCAWCDAERNTSEAERLRAHVERLQESDDALGTIHADAGLAEGHAVERVRALAADLAALRAAVLGWPEHSHRDYCDQSCGAGCTNHKPCRCGSDAANAARAATRKIAGEG